MRIPSFKRLFTKDLLDFSGINLNPEKPAELIRGLDSGTFVMAPQNYVGASKAVSELKEAGQMVILPSHFAVSRELSDTLIKSGEGLIKIDSQPVLRSFQGETEAPARLTKNFLEQNRIRPEDLIGRAISDSANVQLATAGYYWVNSFGEISATTWTRATIAAEMMVMHNKELHAGEVKDRKFYGTNARVKVASRSDVGQGYEFSLFRMPLGRRGDLQPYSGWVNIKHNSPDADTSYRGGEHNKFKAPIIFWSAPAIFGAFLAMEFAPKEQSHRVFRANPFPIPTEPMMNYIDNLRLRTLQLEWGDREKISIRPTNMTEQDLLIGEKTKHELYTKNWIHHGKHNLSYLYTPR